MCENNDFDAIIDELKRLPEQIASEERKMAALSRRMSEIEKFVNDKRTTLYVSVCAEKDLETGKPLFSNAQLRDAAVDERLKNDDAVGAFRAEENEKMEKLSEAKVMLEFYRNQLKALSLITKLLEIRR